MAEFTVTHACGHEVKHRFEGTDAERRKREDWLQSMPCQACWHAEQADVAASKRDALNLPALEGEDSEVQWAETLRIKAVEHNRTFYARVTRKPDNPDEEELHRAIVDAADRAMHELETETSAQWWIDRRFDVIDYVRQATIAAITPLMEE
jgi:hypothetical protein